ncbi:DUF418 domain-containing protein [Halospina sp. K52047b]|uniref:DUF418 domain-containing protein n=1 Tax=Halospina sp. K52047b TaxID=2614160 RepID=UPI00124A16E0|nr:DUF418 domain-containing protein [Halospina sp. K52047b]KAA8978048.1 DUF418 domain-containing protein [Halospina sp. K52047b]
MSQRPERLTSLDVLRGFAILGILVINVRAFAEVSTAQLNPGVMGSFEGAEFWVWFVSHLLFEYSFMPLLAALFGAGVVIQGERLAAEGFQVDRVLRRRMGALALIGLGHLVLIWYGDILLLYAVVGLVAARFRNLPPARLLGWALVFYLVPFGFALLMTGILNWMPAEEYEAFRQQFWSADSALVEQEIEAYRGGWPAQFEHRLMVLFESWPSMLLTESGWRVLALMLVGMALYRGGFFSGHWPESPYRRLGLLGFGIGIPLCQWGVLYNMTHEWGMAESLYAGRQFNIWGGPLVALGWASAVMLALQRGLFRGLLERLRALGRLALSAYLLCSVLGTAFFYTGGRFEATPRLVQLQFILAVWLMLLVIAPLWLRRWRAGPAEWLWRRFAYREDRG